MLKLHLIDSLYMLYSHLCNKYSENRTDGAYALAYRTYSIDRWRWDKHNVGLIDLSSKSTVVQTKISHVTFRGDLSSFWQDLI